MRLPSVNNDQNIGRVLPKMNDEFQYENNAKLIECVNVSAYINQPEFHYSGPNENGINVDTRVCPPLGPEIVDSSSSDANCQSAESEVKSLKEWLVLHNDLIQQQNDEILEKERQIYLLQRENEMLKERLLCIEKGVPYLPEKPYDPRPENIDVDDNSPEAMTQDSCGQSEEDGKENLELSIESVPADDIVTCPSEATDYHQITPQDLVLVESQVATETITPVIEEDTFVVEEELRHEECSTNDLSDSVKTDSEPAECAKDTLSEYNFTVNNFCESESDPMKNIKMSIRRNRVNSGLSGKEQPPVGEKKTAKRMKRKRRRLGKDNQIITLEDFYYVHQSNDDSPTKPEIEGPSNESVINLEVPRWRVKLYTSCYTMEGTENLDDEVYNKRHMRLEIDERRRKRWDVQRIREQRVIDKLKQRQERIANGSKTETDQEVLSSLWPSVEDVKYLEIVDELPVTAFGHPVARPASSNFVLPWLNQPAAAHTRSSNTGKRPALAKRKRFRNRT